MTVMHNPFEELNREIVSLNKKVDLIDEFNTKGLEQAIKILGYKSTETLTKRINKGDILKENEHYRISDSGKYSFNKSALLSIKGLI